MAGAVCVLPLRRAKLEERAPQLLTREDLRRLERESIVFALKQAGGKIFGPNGAAKLLGMKPTTLTSRIVAVGLNQKTGD